MQKQKKINSNSNMTGGGGGHKKLIKSAFMLPPRLNLPFKDSILK